MNDIGAAIFAEKNYNPSNSNPGYKCQNGTSPVKFDGTAELASNIRWLTNISIDSAYNTQLKNTPRLLHDKYLRVATSSMIIELGLKSKSLEEQAVVISKLFDNIMSLSNHYFGFAEPPKNELASGIPAQIGHMPLKIKDPTILSAAQQSILQWANCERSYSASERVEYVSLIIPRVKHSNQLLTLGLPWDDFFWMTENQMPARDQRVKWVVESRLPMLCKVKINRIQKDMNSLVNWGNGAGSLVRAKTTHSNKREFVTSNELAVLSEFCDIEVESIAISNTPTSSNYKPLSDDPGAILSYSYGIIAENYWCSLLRDNTGSVSRTPMAAWLHANDRMECLRYAKLLSKKGFNVNGYGYGRITLGVEPDRKAELKKEAISIGLLPSLDVDVLGEDIDISDAQSPEELLYILYAIDYLPFVTEMDERFVRGVTGELYRHE